MVIDSSALIAIILLELEAERFNNAITKATLRFLSAVNYVEASMVASSRLEGGRDKFDKYISEANIKIVPVTVREAKLARQAFLEYGKGRHPARLNLGDCFAYALARETGEPLLFKGDDFAQTDIAAAPY